MIGQTLAHYKCVALIGKGGMGEVYLAKDEKLGRDVAIKILPAEFAQDVERLGRFQREAKVLASLNHPNIAAIYGLEESKGTHYLVLEFVEGETLEGRLRRSPMPVEESLKLALQIAEALEAAHEKGVIHRDLKPANIKITPDGVVKVLDFGLAKAFAADEADLNLSNSPTLSMAATKQGIILGTAAYMSPEQARGSQVDRRCDIWSFGVVLHEMLTGRQTFAGDTISDTLAAVLRADIDWTKLHADTPADIQTLLRRCLERDRKQRLRDIGEARIALQRIESHAAASEPTSAAAPSRLKNSRLAWSVASIFFAAFVVVLALAATVYFRKAPADQLPIRFVVPVPEGWTRRSNKAVAVSPDGRRLALIAADKNGQTALWVRPLEAVDAQPLKGTEGAGQPFWSPDSRFIGFFAGGKLKKIDIAGGPPQTLCDGGRGGTWNREGVILLNAGGNFPLSRISATGGALTPVTTLDPGEIRHMRPKFLPDGRHFLYEAVTAELLTNVYVGSLDSKERKLLIKSVGGSDYALGHVLFVREETLMAQPFDPKRLELTGDPFPVSEIQTGAFSVSESGVLACERGFPMDRGQLAWYDRNGKQLGVLGETANYYTVELSPDGTRASFAIRDQELKADIWIQDLVRGARSRFTFGQVTADRSIWSPDGKHLLFAMRQKDHEVLIQKKSDGSGAEEVLLDDKFHKYVSSWSADGRFVMYVTVPGSPTTGNDLVVLPLSGERKPYPYLQTQFNEFGGQFSPDGRWVAYQSNDTGRPEIYVSQFPKPIGKRQISTAGGQFPRWRRDGKELFFVASPGATLMAATVNGEGSSFEVANVKPLFQAGVIGVDTPYDVSADGQRFLIIKLADEMSDSGITVVVNWLAALKH